MKKIVILSTPRCGTNLLMLSLDQHPAAVCAGEICNADADPALWGQSADRSEMIRRCNLFKVLTVHRSHWDYDQFTAIDALNIYLYRRDTVAQMRSWVRAAETGIWMAGQDRPYFGPVPTAAHVTAEVAFADRTMMRRADLVISYESMVAHWDQTITTILDRAGWPRQPLAMATRPTPP